MKPSNPRRLAPTLIAMGLFYAGHLPAQTDDPTATPEIPQLPRYLLEVLVFSNQGGTASSSESFEPKLELLPEEVITADAPSGALPANVYGDAQARLDSAAATATPLTETGDKDTAGGDEGGGEIEEAEDEFRFELIDPTALQLGAEYGILERLSAYTPIFHGGWIQEGYPEDRAKPFDLSIIDSMSPLAGSVTFYRSRFLHVRVALSYLAESAPQADQPAPIDPLALPATRYEINEARRLRSGELHYLDHPAFGILILITPEPEPEVLELELGSLPSPLAEPATSKPTVP